MSLNMKYWRARFFPKLKTLIHELICVKNNFYAETIKNDNGSVAMTRKCVWCERNQQLHKIKNYNNR